MLAATILCIIVLVLGFMVIAAGTDSDNAALVVIGGTIGVLAAAALISLATLAVITQFKAAMG